MYTPRHDRADAVTLDFVRDFTGRYLAAWNARDPDGLLALADPEVRWEDPTIAGGVADGHAPVRAWLVGLWRAFPDLTFEFLDGGASGDADAIALTPGGHTAIAPWRCRGTWRGPLTPPGLAPNGRAMVAAGVDLYAFRDGRVYHVRTLTDLRDTMRQLGLAPPPGSRVERAAAWVQRTSRRWR